MIKTTDSTPSATLNARGVAKQSDDGPIGGHYLRKILHGGQRMAKVHSGAEILPKVSTPE